MKDAARVFTRASLHFRTRVCHELYVEVTKEPEDWIQCDTCSTWFHLECINIDPELVPGQFYCYITLSVTFYSGVCMCVCPEGFTVVFT